jgi:hypothetical protein
MRIVKTISCKQIYSILLAMVIIFFFLFYSGCHKQWFGHPIGKEEAAKKIITDIVEKIWKEADQKKGLRVHQYKELLSEGTRVQPAAVPEDQETLILVCKNPSWMFFVDEQPGAHFVHPVRIVLLDANTGEIREIKTDRWPQINGKPVFDTFEKRRNPETIIFDKTPESKMRGKSLEDIYGGSSLQGKTHDPCDAWAVIVCGWNDLPDTFDEDTDDIYNVLIGLGLLDNHIFFVSPHITHAGVDQATSVANVQWAINQVAASADETDKVLFFFSSHGGVDQLYILNFGTWISAAKLDTLLDAITCDELTIIIEACHSGSLIGRYADGTYIAAEDDLTGDGETNRCIFTSASSNTSSYPDDDGVGDPNPGDVGSETIHGYVEAFSVGAADINGDGEISFNEGWQYAWDNDITRINGVNTPQMMHTGLIANNVYNYCYRITGNGDLFISDGPGDVGNNSHDYNSTDIWVTQNPADTDHHDVVSGMNNLVNVAVHNRGTTPIANGSLKVYWGDVSTATSWPGSFNQIGTTYSFASLASGATITHTWTWFVDPSIGLGHNFCLIAVADSPDDPMTGGPPGVTYVAPFDNNIAQKNITIVSSHNGHGTFDFVLKNNTKTFESVDLTIEWVGNPWGSAILILPEDLFGFVKRETIKLENFKIVDMPEMKSPGLRIIGKTASKMSGIPLKPDESKILTLDMQTEKIEHGQRSELRLRQSVSDTIIGVVTVRLQQIDPADCDWVTRLSVETFADLALKFKISRAKKTSQLFAKTVSSGVCREKKDLLKVLSQALLLEKEVAQQLPTEVNPEAMKRYKLALKELKKGVETLNIKMALMAQGKIAESVKDL